MNNLRTYGAAPHTVALIHGGPGAPGRTSPLKQIADAQNNILTQG